MHWAGGAFCYHPPRVNARVEVGWRRTGVRALHWPRPEAELDSLILLRVEGPNSCRDSRTWLDPPWRARHPRTRNSVTAEPRAHLALHSLNLLMRDRQRRFLRHIVGPLQRRLSGNGQPHWHPVPCEEDRRTRRGAVTCGRTARRALTSRWRTDRGAHSCGGGRRERSPAVAKGQGAGKGVGRSEHDGHDGRAPLGQQPPMQTPRCDTTGVGMAPAA
eukprot:scaffold5372_cov114-Isochrysis_galbana.AAC.7